MTKEVKVEKVPQPIVDGDDMNEYKSAECENAIMLLLERSKRGEEYREKRLCLIKMKLTKENRFSSKCREYFEQAETSI